MPNWDSFKVKLLIALIVRFTWPKTIAPRREIGTCIHGDLLTDQMVLHPPNGLENS